MSLETALGTARMGSKSVSELCWLQCASDVQKSL